ncbi:hypothetical protein ZWY2020_007409 [Hordeum vulgare]|nr:hypothetical protein ZWY2020_007409 [Hordeum vulgare]
MGPLPRDVVGISSDEGEGSPRLSVSPGSLGRVALLGDSPAPVPVPRRKKGKSRGARPGKDDDDDDPPVPVPGRRKGKSRGARPSKDDDDDDPPVPVPRRRKGTSRGARPSKDDDDDDPPVPVPERRKGTSRGARPSKDNDDDDPPVPVPRRRKGKSRGARPSKDNDNDDEDEDNDNDDEDEDNDPPVPVPRRRKGKSRGVRPRKDNDDEDDDCVILDGDPDGPAVVAGAKGKSAGDGASDEVEIVAAKGEVACKDFPHSRHLCAELPFGTTSHPSHCRMCYCYVCDAPAPCKHWGKGLLDDDHCHATNEETKWKTLRQSFKRKTLLAPYPEKQQNLEPGEEAAVSGRNLPYNFDIERLGQLFRSFTARVHAKFVDRGTG